MSIAEALILDALRSELVQEAGPGKLPAVLLVGVQSCATVRAANDLLGCERVALLHLDRAAGGVGCGFGNREAFLGGEAALGIIGGEPGPFALVGINVGAARSYVILREIVGQAARWVGADGVVLAAGLKKGGAEVAARSLRERFSSVTLLTYRQGERIYRASGTTCDLTPIATVLLRGRQLRLLQDDRIFARGRLDPATELLAGVFEIPPGAAVLDLGSGSGVLGILAALLEPSSRVWLVDSDPLAVEVSRRNAALNHAPNVTAHLSDLLADLLAEYPGQTFDVVLMNPPFHQGRRADRSLGERFIRAGGDALRPGGTIYVVCNRFLRYEPTLEQVAGPVRELAGDRRYKVLAARRRDPEAWRR